jgi:hypothetical protein
MGTYIAGGINISDVEISDPNGFLIALNVNMRYDSI